MSASLALPVQSPPDVSVARLSERLSQVEAFGGQVSDAIESLVSALLEVKSAAAPLPAPALAEMQALQAKVRDLEQQLTVERSCRDFASVSRMHPKERIAVFVGTTFFGDNVKYAWSAFRRQAADLGIACWWLPFNADQQRLVTALGGNCLPAAYCEWSAEHLHVALSAAVVVLTDHFLNANPFAAAMMDGARLVQLWHGLSIKEIGLRNLPDGRSIGPHLARVLNTCGHFASFVGTTATNEADWRRWLAFERYAPIGYPRNDVLHREPVGDDLANVDPVARQCAADALAKGRKVFVYAPTFRDANRGKWLLQAGLPDVARAVAARGDCLLVNLHPVEAPMARDLSAALPGVVFVEPRTDIYPLLALSSALVTDYSSLIFDYLHVDRPIYLFRPDHESYVAQSRKLFDGRMAELPGPVLGDATALSRALGRAGGKDAYRDARRRMAAATFDALDGEAASRVVALISAEVDRAVAH